VDLLKFRSQYPLLVVEILQLTYPKKSGKGRPWSLAKAHVKRETDARELNIAMRPFQRRKHIMTVVPAFDLVAP
jgi:hypothetical protein